MHGERTTCAAGAAMAGAGAAWPLGAACSARELVAGASAARSDVLAGGKVPQPGLPPKPMAVGMAQWTKVGNDA